MDKFPVLINFEISFLNFVIFRSAYLKPRCLITVPFAAI
jgi:hypothetical protein